MIFNLILKDGKIVLEKYWGNNILNTASFDQNSNWYWTSAAKILISFGRYCATRRLVKYQMTEYLGGNWTGLPLEKENLILIKHQLTITTGLDYSVSNPDCTDSDCLQYKKDTGEQWYYHNAPYSLIRSGCKFRIRNDL